jgi:ADP-heptose:LPS heptosyltransferase
LIGIHPGARWHYRQWNKKKFAQLSDLISKTYGNVKIIFLQDIENNLTNEIIAMAELKPLSIKLSIGQMISFFEICDIFIGNDSGPAHLAAAIKKPAIVLFGPEDPVRFSPYGANCIVIHKKLPCNPCNQVKCIRPKNSCMDLITVDEVLKEIGKTINKIKFGKCSYLIA